MTQTLTDAHGRKIDYLRISLTDACNFRCVYCLPPEGPPAALPPSGHLTRSQIVRLVRLAGTLGISRLRLTGGEPLLRKDVVEIVRDLKRVKTVRDLSMTTNASLLEPLLGPLKAAGLDRLNISLDSLDPGRFRSVTLSDYHGRVRRSVRAALAEGFPVKLNIVAIRGLEEEEINRFVEFAVHHDTEVRFLEFMPLCGTSWRPDLVIPIPEIRRMVLGNFDLEEEPRRPGQVARTYRPRSGAGRVGFIGSLTESFCNDCSRVRITADGRIRPCLFSDTEVPVGGLLRDEAPDEVIVESIRLAAALKPRGNHFRENPFDPDEGAESVSGGLPLIRSIGG